MPLTVSATSAFSQYDWNSDGRFNDSVNDFLTYFNTLDAPVHRQNSGDFAGEKNPNPIVDPGSINDFLFGPFSGTQYALEFETGADDLGFIIKSSSGEYLSYTFFSAPDHTIYGEIESISFGYNLIENDATGEFTFEEELVTISGFDTIGLNNGVDENGNVIDRDTKNNSTHNLIDGLKDGDSSELIEQLNGNLLATSSSELIALDSFDELDQVLVA